MTNKEMWLTNIDNVADEVCAYYGVETLTFILSKYNASCTEDIIESDLPNVFNELQALIQSI